MTGELFAVAALVMFSLNIILTKLASNRLNLNAGFLISITVNLAFSAAVFLIELTLRRDPLIFKGFAIAMFMLAGACSTYLGRWFLFEAIARLGPAKASLFQVSSPLITLVIAWIFLGQQLRTVSVLAMVITMLGLLLVSAPSRRGGPPAMGDASTSRASRIVERWKSWVRSGALLAAGSSAAYAVASVLRGAGIREWDEPIAGALLGAIAGVALQLMVGSGQLNVVSELARSSRSGVALYALGGVISISAQTCMIVSMKYIPVAITTVITLCTPLLVIPMSYYFLKNEEAMTGMTLLGAALTMAGIAALVLA